MSHVARGAAGGADAGAPTAAAPGPPAAATTARTGAFADAVYRIASSFVSLADTDTIINASLESLGEACAAGRAYVFLFDFESGTMSNTHEWCAAGVEPQMEMLTDLDLDTFPWWMDHLYRGDMILVPDVSAMPQEAAAERELLEAQSIRSVLVLPIYREQDLAGFIGLDDVDAPTTWESSTREYLKVASDMVTSTITRARRSAESAQRTQELEYAYEDLKRTQARLLQSEKLASIGMLAAGVAHEINNPLGFIRSNTESMQDYLRQLESILSMVHRRLPVEEIAAHARRVDTAFLLEDCTSILETNLKGIDRIGTIVRSLKDFTRAGTAGEPTPVDVNESIRNALAVSTHRLKHTATVDFEPGDVPEVLGNANELNESFLNIILNAVAAIEEAGRAGDGRIRITTSHDGNTVHCTVDDNGPGISEEVRMHIFEPFYTTRPPGEGTGLGMSIVYDTIVNRHGGEIGAGNNPDGGARIRVSLPRA